MLQVDLEFIFPIFLYSQRLGFGLLNRADIPAMPLHSPDALVEDAHLEATGLFSFVEHPSEGRLRQMTFPSTWSITQPQCSRHVPRVGEHSVEVLREIGYSDDRIDALIRSGGTATTPGAPPS